MGRPVKPPPLPSYALLARFVGTGRVMTRPLPKHVSMPFYGAAEPWLSPLFPPSRGKRPKEPRRPPPMPMLRRRRRKKRDENQPPRRFVPRWQRGGRIQTAKRPEDWRTISIRAAWAVHDWHTLKALGEIDEVPEP